MRKGKALERLVETLEHRLNKSNNISIESPKYLTDRTNRKKREHDVLITIDHGHHSVTISIECKDRKKPVGVPDVEAFSTKCQHTKVNQGIFVSTSGYAKSAIETAKHLGIRCLTLDEVTQLDWLAEDAKVIVYGHNLKTANLKYVVIEEPSYPHNEYDLFSPDGQLITDELIKLNLKERCNLLPWEQKGELQEYLLTFNVSDFYLKHRVNEEKVGVTALEILVAYVYEVTESTLTRKSYKDESADTEIAELAVASVNLSGQPQQLTIVDDGNSRSILLTQVDK